MSAHVLFYKMIRIKAIKCETCQAFYVFCNEFNKFNNTRARILAYFGGNFLFLKKR